MPPSLRATPLFSSPHLTIGVDRAQRILVITRSSQPFERVEDIEAARLSLAKVFPASQRAGFAILNDYRAAPLRVHPALEPAFARFRAETELGFERAAQIVGTPVGRIRTDRMREAAPLPMKIFGSLDEALVFLTER